MAADDRDLCTLAEAKEWIGLAATSVVDDVLIQSIITDESVGIGDYLARQLTEDEFTERYTGLGGTSLCLRQTPITGVSAVRLAGVALAALEEPDAGGRGFFHDDNYLYLRGCTFPRTPLQAIVVTYTAGWDETTRPQVFHQVIKGLVVQRYRERPNVGKSSDVLGSQQVNYEKKDMPAWALRMLAPYRRLMPAA